MHSQDPRRGRWALMLLIALVVNALLAWALIAALRMSAGTSPRLSPTRVQVALVPEDEAAQEDGQIVRNDALVNEKVPKDAKRRSEFDNEVERETVAPRGRRVPASRPPAARPSQAAASRRAAPAAPSGADRAPRSAPTQAKQPGSLVRIDPLGRLAQGEVAQPAQAAAAAAANRASQGTPALEGQGPRLHVDKGQMARMFNRPGTMQAIDGVDEGSQTLLNTKRSRYASFFNRVRDAIAQHWHPQVLHSAHDPYGKIYGTQDRKTRVTIMLRKDGSVFRVRTDGASGVDYLDQEAVRAIWAAQPFSNPPQDLVDPQTQRIDFRFMFTLEIGGRSRIFRMRN